MQHFVREFLTKNHAGIEKWCYRGIGASAFAGAMAGGPLFAEGTAPYCSASARWDRSRRTHDPVEWMVSTVFGGFAGATAFCTAPLWVPAAAVGLTSHALYTNFK